MATETADTPSAQPPPVSPDVSSGMVSSAAAAVDEIERRAVVKRWLLSARR